MEGEDLLTGGVLDDLSVSLGPVDIKVDLDPPSRWAPLMSYRKAATEFGGYYHADAGQQRDKR